MSKRILIVNPGSKYKYKFLKHIGNLGYELILLKDKSYELGKDIQDIFTEQNIVNSDFGETNVVLHDVLTFFVDKNKPDGVMTYWERDTYLSALIAKEFKLNSPTPESIMTSSRNKFAMSKRLREYGLITYKSILIGNIDQINNLATGFKPPMVIKPIAGASSKGVIKINSHEEITDEFIQTYKDITDESNDKIYKYSKNQYLLSEYIIGKEYSVEGYNYQGKTIISAIIEKHAMNANSFIEIGDSSISELSNEKKIMMANYVKESIKALGLENTVFHAELKFDEKENLLNIIEVNPRIGGDYIWEFVKESYGIDLIQKSIEIATSSLSKDEGDTFLDHKSNLLVGTYFLPKQSGTVKSVRFKEPSKYKSLIYQIELPEVGEVVGIPPERYDYLGWAIIKLPISESHMANRILNDIHSSTEIEIT